VFGKFLRTVLARGEKAEAGISQALRRYAEGDAAAAEVCCEQRLVAAPGDLDALCLLALTREALGERAFAREAWTRVLALDPAHAEALCAIGEPARATGLRRGTGESAESIGRRLHTACEMVSFWAQQDRLWRHGIARDPRIPLPVWDGGPLAGRHILLHSMRGFGDTINFVRFASALAARGAVVHLECGRPLHRLFASCAGVAEVVETGAPHVARGCDLQAPLVTLLRHLFFAELNCARGAYLKADEEDVTAWEQRLADLRGLRVGLCWAGDSANRNDARRSVAIAAIEPLLSVPGTHWVSLQKGPASAQLAPFIQAGINDWTDELADFADTAALIARLDLVVSVDTAVAHLAGALGKPVWVLCARDLDRRWEVLDDTRRLYPQVRLFRQSEPADWRAPVAAAAASLSAEIAKRSSAHS